MESHKNKGLPAPIHQYAIKQMQFAIRMGLIEPSIQPQQNPKNVLNNKAEPKARLR